MNLKSKDLADLSKIKTKNTNRGSFKSKYTLTQLFKTLRQLFKSRKDVSEKNIMKATKEENGHLKNENPSEILLQYLDNFSNVTTKEKVVQNVEQGHSAKQETTTLNENPYPDNFDNITTKEKVVQNVEQQSSAKQKITFSNGNPYPDNFYNGTAIANGSCFFDSFRQSLEQQKGIKVTVEQLRMNCLEFAFDAPEWFIRTIANSHDNNGQRRNETVDLYAANILENNRWGDPEVEGRILCEKYGVKLHVIESNPWHAVDSQQDPFLHQLIDNRGSINAGEYNRVDYNNSSVLHIINKGGAHFEPLLDRKKSDYLFAKQLQEQEYSDARERTSQVKSDELLVQELQKHYDRMQVQAQESFNSKCSMEEVRSTPHQHQIPQFVR